MITCLMGVVVWLLFSAAGGRGRLDACAAAKHSVADTTNEHRSNDFLAAIFKGLLQIHDSN
jgi:hypothetical protein